MLAKLLYGLDKLKDGDFLVEVGNILAALTGNARFPEPWPAQLPTLAALSAAQQRFEDAYHVALDGAHARIVDRDAARAELDGLLRRLPPYLEMMANGDVAALASTGFELRHEKTPFHAPLGAPEGWHVKHGEKSRSVVGGAHPVPGAHSYEVQTTQGDPRIESSWAHALTSSAIRSVPIADLSPGEAYWFRVRAIGRSGAGVWSAPVSLIAV